MELIGNKKRNPSMEVEGMAEEVHDNFMLFYPGIGMRIAGGGFNCSILKGC